MRDVGVVYEFEVLSVGFEGISLIKTGGWPCSRACPELGSQGDMRVLIRLQTGDAKLASHGCPGQFGRSAWCQKAHLGAPIDGVDYLGAWTRRDCSSRDAASPRGNGDIR